MADGSSPSTDPPEGEVIIERVFDAPRALVFQAFTEREHMMRWWGPAGWTLPVCAIDLRPGGVWHYGMRGPNGEESWGKAVYREVVAPERIVYVDSFSDADGNLVPPTQYGLAPSWPAEMLVTVTFTEEHGKTRVTLWATGLTEAPPAEREATQRSWAESFDRLAGHLASG